ncbi:SIMPL domain-containing protein [Rubellimicrobium aerolatum]|uniref:SIMPL domain-containing protein n=1 Tax=Rubellimicrobium aerolatum TaxID=490979 RepID=A0ABW0SEI3_9RHOB|nr:SIMPL domain-containing protein [Rubellimicrobium aerolatum]MBP1805629.1 uncharacterized protein YggE [Rubellimicrobium aerolatum]
MPSILKAAVPALILAAAPLALLAQSAPPPPSPIRTIQVVGEGRASAVPDMAHVSLGVSQQAPTAQAATQAMSEGTAAVLARLGTEGIPQADIQTGQLALDPAYDYDTPDGQPRMTGFVATQILEVTVRDLGALGGVLDAVVADGANRINGIGFDVAEPRALTDEARREAVADARARAELFAQAAGVTLGEVLAIGESGSYGPPMPMFDRQAAPAAAGSVPVAPGSLRLSASVSVTYAIAE